LKIGLAVAVNCLILLFALATSVGASDGSGAEQFLGSPLLVLVALLVVDLVALAYHRFRK